MCYIAWNLSLLMFAAMYPMFVQIHIDTININIANYIMQ